MTQKLSILVLLLVIAVFTQAQNIGIGTSNPTQKLHVNGAIKIGNTDVNGTDTGSIRWNAERRDFEGYVGDRWMSFTGGKSGWGNNETYATENGGIYATWTTDTSFGEPISLSGNRLAIAIPRDENGIYKNSGAVMLGTLNADGRLAYQTTIFPPTLVSHNYFGKSVALSGNNLVVGEPGAQVDANFFQGKAYVYALGVNNQPGSPQTLPQMGIFGDPNDRFGSTVAISGDYIAVAATEKTVGANVKQGRIYMFRRAYIFGQPTDAFVSDTTLTAPDGHANMQFGKTISIAGNCMTVGVPYATAGGDSEAGKVYIYRRVNNAWSYEATITSTNPQPKNWFGTSVSINAMGDSLVVGAPDFYGNGYAMLFAKSGNNWVFKTVFQVSGSGSDGFGASVDFKFGKILVGANRVNVGINTWQGKAYLFTPSGTSWTREAVFTPQSGAPYMGFGSSVQMGQNVAVISAPAYFSPLARGEKGSVYWFFK